MEAVPADQRSQCLDLLSAHHRQLETWARCCPPNFDNRAALVGAEIARVEGRDLDAMRLYDRAIGSARENGFVHNEAVANELAGRFYAARGFAKIARTYLTDARYGYRRWGADGKVRQLDELYPHLGDETPAPDPKSTIGAPVERLDLATVIHVSQAVSSEIVLEKLVDTIMRTAIEQAGAERGLLIIQRGAEFRIEAEATIRGEAVVVQLRDQSATTAALPEAIINFVARARESAIIGDASAEPPFADDPYVRQHQIRSILCLPLINQGKFVGALYLENNLARNVFSTTRIAVLKLLASQAATAIENSRLYRDLAAREAKIRRLVDANIIGIMVADDEGQIVEANDAFLRMLGFDREDLDSGRIRRTGITPPEWRNRTAQAIAEAKATGAAQPFENEYFHKNGNRVPVLVGLAGADEGASQRIAFVLDLTERRRAEEALLRSNRQLRALIDCNQALVRATDEVALVQRICEIFVEEAGYRLAWVGYAEQDAARAVRFIAHAGGDDGYLKTANITWADDSKRGRGLGGLCIRTGETQISQDIATDPRMAPWRDAALQRGGLTPLASPWPWLTKASHLA